MPEQVPCPTTILVPPQFSAGCFPLSWNQKAEVIHREHGHKFRKGAYFSIPLNLGWAYDCFTQQGMSGVMSCHSLCLCFFLTTLALRLPPLETHLPYWQVAQITWVCIQAFCSAFLAKLVAKNQHQLSAWRVNCLGHSSLIEPQSTSRGAEVQPIQAQSTHRKKEQQLTRKNKPAAKYWDSLLGSNR